MVFLYLSIKPNSAISGPPLGPTLGQYGISIGPFCDSFNEQTKIFRSTYPLRVFLFLNKDGSYTYNLYLPRLVFFFKTLLKKENAPAETPRYFYFIGYILSEACMINRSHSRFLSSRILHVFSDKSIEIEKLSLVTKYKNVFRKGSFRSITPELLFETVAFYTMNDLEIRGLFQYFTELRDYFIIDYSPFFFPFDYIVRFSSISSEYNFDNIDSNVIFLNKGEFSYNVNFIFSKYNFLLKIIEVDPKLISLYSYYVDKNNIMNYDYDFAIYSAYYIYYSVDILNELCEGFFSNNFIGFDFSCNSSLQGKYFVENPLFILGCNSLNQKTIQSNISFDTDSLIDEVYIFVFSVYISFLYFSQYNFYTNSDFRYISTRELHFKQINSYLKHLGLFLS